MKTQPSVIEAAGNLRTNALRSAQRLAHDLDAGFAELREAVRSEVRNNPIRSVLVAAGAGYVLGGGLAAPLTRRLARLAFRAMILPALDQPAARLWDWIRSEPRSENPAPPARRHEPPPSPSEGTREPAVAKGGKHHGTQ